MSQPERLCNEIDSHMASEVAVKAKAYMGGAVMWSRENYVLYGQISAHLHSNTLVVINKQTETKSQNINICVYRTLAARWVLWLCQDC